MSQRSFRAVILPAIVVAVLLFGVAALGVRAGLVEAAPGAGQDLPEVLYVVQPGDTLAAIAERTGVSLRDLMHENGIQHPGEIYPGQSLRLGDCAGLGWEARSLAWGEELLLLSRAAGVTLEQAAKANRLLHPTRLPVGQSLLLPRTLAVRELDPPTDVKAPRIEEAVRYNVRLWDLLWLNPTPYVEGLPLLIPETADGVSDPGASMLSAAAAPASQFPYPVTHLSLAPQPVIRGQTALVNVETAEPVDCVLRYLDQAESCHGAAEGRYYGLIGLPTMTAPGRYTVTVEVRSDPPTSPVAIPLPLLVSGGRYDYERIDLPPSRQSLLDPALSQAERERIAALRQTRSPVRHWTYPFRFPLQGSVTSYFGSRRSYGYGFGSFHGGTDFRGEVGAPVFAPAAGVVILAEPLIVQGHAVIIDHGWGVLSGYWHLSRIDVEVGQLVAQGEQIAAVGNTGLSTGPHLHWELWVNGVSVNALPWLDEDGPISGLREP
ncbi:MAG: LysM peptidoglycan-binding domain-containing M23 family metallopeptidase [Anaerolineae bacterium]